MSYTSVEWSRVLSAREREVALLVSRGLANKEIARDLRLSLGTVKQHVHNIFLKIGAHRRSMLISLMRESGITENAAPASVA
jgi:two-component system, NarL family, nitrate/nitrite response regulator NarL